MYEGEPRITIGIPVYNGEKFIEEAIQSILSQSLKDLRLIISDNCSSDRTAKICEKYELQDSRVSYIRNETNVGASENYNRLFRMATTPYFKWAAADDLLEPGYLSRCIDVLESNPTPVIVQTQSTFVDQTGKVLEVQDPGWHLPMENAAERMSYVIRSGHFCNIIFGVIRREALAKTHLIGSYPGGDYRTLCELAHLGPFLEISGNLFRRRLHPDASSQNLTMEWQLKFYTPHQPIRFCLPTLVRALDHMRTVALSTVTLKEKISLTAQILRYLRWGRQNIVRELKVIFRQIGSRMGLKFNERFRKQTN